MNPNLKGFWKAKARTKVLYGGRASGKTWDAATNAIRLVHKYPLRFLCTRQFQNRITESVYTNLKQQIERFGLQDDFEITNNRIVSKRTGGEFIFYGLWRNIDEIKSLEGIDICWIEEAHNLTKEQWEILEPTVRKEGSQFWIIFNPRLRTDFVYKNFVVNPPNNCVVKKVNYDSNPYLSDTMIELIKNKKDEDYEEYRHIYLGEPRTEEYNTLYSYELVETAMAKDVNSGVDRSGAFVYALDVARYGDDSTVLTKRKGFDIYEMTSRKGMSTVEIANWIAHMVTEEDRMPDAIIVDAGNMGAGVIDQMLTKGLPVIEANYASGADEPDKYVNKRTEMYFKLKEYLSKGIRLPKDDELLEELVSVTYSFNEMGKMKLPLKEKIREELGRSPDKADAIAMQFFTTIVPQSVYEDELYQLGADDGFGW